MSAGLKAIEAVIDVDGKVTLADVPHLTHPARAIVTVLMDEEPERETGPLDPADRRFQESMVKDGLLKCVQGPPTAVDHFDPIVISGPPLSETIMRDRGRE